MRRVIGFILIAIIGVLVFGNIVMWLWNALMPVLFHLPIISFAQALGSAGLIKDIIQQLSRRWPRTITRRKGLREKWMDSDT